MDDTMLACIRARTCFVSKQPRIACRLTSKQMHSLNPSAEPGQQTSAVDIEAKFTSDPVDKQVYDDRWEAIWAHGLPPGQRWDCGRSSAVLLNLIQSGQLPVKGNTALVPGCGRGYDVISFAEAGAALAVGLDISQTAVDMARQWCSQQPLSQEMSARVSIEQGDFFSWKHPSCPQGFDLGYDYTFGCAMHPSMRQDWAKGWAMHIKPGGELVTLVFPVNPEMNPDLGPPFPVTPGLYQELLTAVGFEQIELQPVPAELSLPGRGGKEWLGRWRRT